MSDQRSEAIAQNGASAQNGQPDEREAFPKESLAEALPALRRPFGKQAVEFRLGSQRGQNGPHEILSYVQSRAVSARLNHVAGPHWHEEHEIIKDELLKDGQGNVSYRIAVLCKLTVFDVTHIDVGVGESREYETALKGAYSDALKRPAVRFGVGEYLYSLGEIVMWDNDLPHSKSSHKAYLNDELLASLRNRYAQWTEKAAPRYGKVLHHGEEGGTLEPAATTAPVAQAAVVAQGLVAQPPTAPAQAQAAPVAPPTAEGAQPEASAAPQQQAGEAVATGGLQAISDGTQAAPPITTAEVAEIGSEAERLGYAPESAAALGRVLFGERVERLSSDQAGELVIELRLAAEGGITQQTLATQVTRASNQEDAAGAAERIREWIERRVAAAANGAPGEAGVASEQAAS